MADITLLTARQRSIIAFAVGRFMDQAHERANAAAQDKEGRYFKPGAVTAFVTDAADAEELLGVMRLRDALLIPAPAGVEGRNP
jgi:hypothetical protein